MIRAAFSTLGCPGLPLSQVARIAARDGFSGVEVRAADGEPVHTGLGSRQRRAAARLLASQAVTPLSIASYVRIAGRDPLPRGARRGAHGDAETVTVDGDEAVAAGAAHGRLAADIGARYLRVFPGGPRAAPPAGTDADDDAAVRRLLAIRDAVAGTGVTVALETHDSHPRGTDVARILDRCPGVLAIWDVLHTWRAGEPPADTLVALAGRLAYVQVKDVVSAADLTPLPPGDGSLPLDDVADALRRTGFDGWVSWEYERAWFPDRPPLDRLAGRVAAWIADRFG